MSVHGEETTAQSLLALNPCYNPDEYTMYFLDSKHEVLENDIFQVFDSESKNRVGWVFPIQSLLSNSHTYANNDHYIKYAYVATYKLLCAGVFMSNDYDELRLKDENCMPVVLVLCNDNCNRIPNFDINHYVISLYDNGFVVCAVDANNKKSRDGDNASQNHAIIHIRPISSQLHDNEFIKYAYETILPRKDLMPVTRFHMLYQVVEILIGIILRHDFAEFINRIGADASKYFDTIEDLRRITGEGARVHKLLSTDSPGISRIDSEKREFCNKDCIGLLTVVNEKKKTELSGNLYRVRCLIVHSYHMIDIQHIDCIDEINDSFERVLADVLTTFEYPKPDINSEG